VSRLALLSCVLVTGCFYIDPINQRPSIDIRQTSADEVFRTSTVRLEGVANDPEGQLVFRQWRVYSCIDAEDFSTCDSDPFHTEILDDTEFVVPETLADLVTPVESLLVILEAKDDYGAIARPRQELIIPVSNHPAVLELSMSSRYMHRTDYVVNTPIDLFAVVADPDDGPANILPLVWTVFSPMTQPAYNIAELDVADPTPTTSLQFGKRFIADGPGDWEVQVTAIDPLGAETTKSLKFKVEPDSAPCLAQWAPIAAPTGSAWPLSEPTLFQIGVVTDDLDPYPTVPGDAILGTSTFAWSIKQPGAGTRTPLGFTGSGVALDPGNYAPGDIVELRVEIQDRVPRAINCADAQATCSVISDDTCIQRLTWRMEVH